MEDGTLVWGDGHRLSDERHSTLVARAPDKEYAISTIKDHVRAWEQAYLIALLNSHAFKKYFNFQANFYIARKSKYIFCQKHIDASLVNEIYKR
jgi:hypothetical protein